MAFENLRNIFNNREDRYPGWKHDISQNINDNTVSDNLFNHTFGTNFNYEELINITPIQNEQSPSPLMAIAGIGDTSDTIVNGHSRGKIRVNYQGGLLQNNIDLNQKENYPYSSLIMEQPKPDLTLKNLGSGKYKLESLFDPTHGNTTPDREAFGQPGRISSDLQLHTSPHGPVGSLNIKDTQGYGGRGGEPHVVHPIGFSSSNERKTGYDRDGLPLRAAGEDASRLLNYYLSADGVQFMLKENTTNYAIGDGFQVTYPKGLFRSVMAPPIPGFNTGFLNGFGQGRRLQSSGTIPSFRKPFRIEYSKMVRNPLQKLQTLAIQGDVAAVGFDTAPLEKLIKKTRGEIKKESEARAAEMRKVTLDEGAPPAGAITPPTGLAKLKEGVLDAASFVKVKAKNALIKQTIKLAEGITTIPTDVKPPRFLDLRGGGTDHRNKLEGYVDVFSNEESLLGGLSPEPPLESMDMVDKGDFYVRFRDLRANEFLYFRGFVTGITENLTPSWNPTTYIGRSEDVWIYQKGERDLSFNLRVAAANIKEFSAMNKKMDRLTSLVYPEYHGSRGNERMKPPFTELYLGHIGSQNLGQFGYIKSLTYTVNEQGDWDALTKKPRVFDIAISYQILHMEPPSDLTKFYGATVVGGISE